MSSSAKAASPKADVNSPVALALFGFGSKLLASLLQSDSKRNVFTSPLSIAAALTMATVGSTPDSNVQRELLSLFGVPSESALVNEIVGPALKRIGKLGDGVEVRAANSVWADNGISAEYVSALQQGFGAHAVGHVSIPEINAWVEAATQGKVTNLLSDLPDNVAAVLVNTIYFKGEWEKKFTKNDTHPSEFTLEGVTEPISVPMMHMKVSTHRYVAHPDGTQAVALAYKNGQHSCALILPPPGVLLADFATSLGVEGVKDIIRSLKEERVEIHVPKFKAEFEQDLVPTLSTAEFGLKESVTNSFQWGRLAGDSAPYRIGMIIHKAILEFDEEGTVAAAATAVSMLRGSGISQHAVFRANRPFLIVVYDRVIKAPLFIGGIRSPQIL